MCSIAPPKQNNGQEFNGDFRQYDNLSNGAAPVIGILGSGAPALNAVRILRESGIEVAYLKVDSLKRVDDEFMAAVNETGVELFTDSYPDRDVDMVFVINYNKIIPEDFVGRHFVVNYHVGLLPKWRGNSANGWAVINGEKSVGYTIHRVNAMLDDGPIYYRFAFPVRPGDTYFEARQAMNADFDKMLPQVLKSILKNPESYLDIPNDGFVYCSKFRPIDGVISDWNVSTEMLLRRFYVFAPPLGTGLKFNFKGQTYDIMKLSAVKGFAISTGVCGGVVYKLNGSVWVKTKDTAISLDEIRCNGEVVSANQFIIGQRL
jgi:methionyl-tRNA formyltransferase